MRHVSKIKTLVFAGAVVIAAVCASAQLAAAQLNKDKTETKGEAQTKQDYAYSQKDEFVGKMKKEMGKIQEKLDQLSAKVDKSGGAAKADARIRIEAVRKKLAQANKQLDKAGNATESTWDGAQRGFKKSYGELKDSFRKARAWLSEKIKP